MFQGSNGDLTKPTEQTEEEEEEEGRSTTETVFYTGDCLELFKVGEKAAEDPMSIAGSI